MGTLSRNILKAKLAFLALALLCSFASLVLTSNSDPSHTRWPLVTAILDIMAFMLAPVLTYLNHTRTRTSSSMLLLFWPAYILLLLIWIRSITISALFNKYDSHIWFRFAAAALGGMSFALELTGTEPGSDHGRDISDNESPIVRANLFSLWSFGWITPLMKLGSSKFLTEEDMYALLPAHRSANLDECFQKATERHPSLWVSLFLAYGRPFAFAACMKVVQDCLAFSQPLLLRFLLSYIAAYQQSHENGSKGPSPYKGFAIAFLMFSAAMTQTIILHQYFQQVYETGMRVRSGLITAIYRKALVLSGDARAERHTGDIVNLMTIDAAKIQELCTYGLIMLSGPLQVILAFIFLYKLLGWPAFVGVAVMVISVPIQTVVAKHLKRLQLNQMQNRDKRMRLMKDLLANIKSIKLFRWEPAYTQRILGVRNDHELRIMRSMGLLSAYDFSLWNLVPLLVAFSSFVAAASTSRNPLTADLIFPAMALFMLLQFPLTMFAMITSSVVEAAVSMDRLSNFLRATELQPDARQRCYQQELGDEMLKIRDGEFQWSVRQAVPTLHGIDLTVRRGELVGILGRVGAGKTSLLSAIIGEMRKTEGEVTVCGAVAYCPQTPWIMNTTIRENILFSHTFDAEFYEAVLEACALRQDIALMIDGDMTYVGENGVTLSGGQRARISLARAVYARADLYLLDDVLAAVDSQVARHVFDQVIGPEGILATKARILVTNTSSAFMPYDQSIILRRGIIFKRRSPKETVTDESKGKQKFLLSHDHVFDSHSGESSLNGLAENLFSEDDVVLGTNISQRKSDGKPSSEHAGLAKAGNSFHPTMQSDGSKEHIERGRVKMGVYGAYVKAASMPAFVSFLVSELVQQISQVLANVILKQWGEHNQIVGSNAGMSSYLILYGLCTIMTVFSSLAGTILLFVFCALRSAKYLHNTMLLAVMHAPLSFFEQTPSGRILNVFSRDIYVIDQVLAQMMVEFLRSLSSICGVLTVISTSFPFFIIFVPVLGYLYQRIMVYYLATSRELKRLDASSRSHVFSSFSETLAGLSTIRAFNRQNLFFEEFQRRNDRNQMCYLPTIYVNRWLAVRLEALGALLIFIVTILACSALVTRGVNADLVGLVLSYALNTTSFLNWLVRSGSEVEQNMVSVERILHQTNVTPEAPEYLPEALPRREWPLEGKVEFKRYAMRYRPELDLALRDISLEIKPREKVGVCGRTGAGKSSLLSALFRTIEPASGTILIDGVDITTLGLHDLRSAISVIPQESQMFEGTMRENLDQTGSAKDSDIWVALEQTHLKEFVGSLPGGLDSKVQEGGMFMSSGQRQLLCFARALLCKSKILVLDEATSSIDLDTDRAIQDILRGPAFTNTTVLTIAHRLDTIIDSDRVIVLSDGKVVEFDTPKVLLGKSGSMFALLVKEAGIKTR